VRKILRSLAVIAAAAIAVAAVAVPAFATFTTPSDNPHTVTGASDGSTPFDIVVDGFTSGQPVFLELCDGSTVGTGWDPNFHCDNGTAPSPAAANGSGQASFLASDPNHQFPPAGTPLVGQSPSGLFACVATLSSGHNNGDPDAAQGGLPTWNNCKVRASSNNAASTTDQQFLGLVLPGGGGGPVTPEVPFAVLLPIGAVAVGAGFFAIRRRRAASSAA
jgi:hypothetical protein